MGWGDDLVGQMKKAKKKLSEAASTAAGYANAGSGVETDGDFQRRVDANPSAMTSEERKRRSKIKLPGQK